jgi:toll-like receptor 2/toll-like receptor 13
MVINRKAKHQRRTEASTFRYDAFVAHHENDVLWVKNQMLPNLEQAPNRLRLCIHARDFEVGNVIEENIVQSIKESRKTILVISEDFLKSHWCYFEMQMARAESFEVGRSLIIPILMTPISHRTKGVSQTLLNILKKRTFIVWPNDDSSQHAEFWGRVRQAIQSPQDTPNRCECGRALFRDGRIFLADGGSTSLPRIET